jgi:hypothetical protein
MRIWTEIVLLSVNKKNKKIPILNCCGFVNEKMFLIDNDYFLQNVNVFLSKQRQNKILIRKI